MKNYYQILGLPPDASPRKIKEKYRKLAKHYHPDRITDPAQKSHHTEKFKAINEAYEALSDIAQQTNLNPTQRKLDFLYRQGQQLLTEKKWSQAMIVFNEILAIDSTYRNAFDYMQEARRKHKRLAIQYTKADTLYQQQRWSEVVKIFEVILGEDPSYRDVAQKYKKARREQLKTDFMQQY